MPPRFDAYRRLLRPLLFRLDAETAHHLAETALAWGFPWGLAGAGPPRPDPRLCVHIGPLAFDNPVGLAPGLDKNARTVGAIGRLGFGYMVVGSILPQPRPGNPRPRLLRDVAQESLINCYGLPSDGLDACVNRLRRVRPGRMRLLANLDALSVEDYERSCAAVEPWVDAIEIGTRCPNNTDDGGEFQQAAPFERLLQRLARARRKPLFVKLLPWRTEGERQQRLEAAELALRYGVDGLTLLATWDREEPRLSLGRGHISGRIALPRTLETVRELARLARGRAAIKALGGIASGEDAFRAIAAGATLVELLTAFVYQGWQVAWRINGELSELMRANGCAGLDPLRGSASQSEPAVEPAERVGTVG